MDACLMGLFGVNAKIKFDKISGKGKNTQHQISIKFQDAFKILDLKQEYFGDITQKMTNDIKELEKTHKNDPLKKQMQINKLKLIHLYKIQRSKLLDIKLKLEEINLHIESGTLIRKVHEVLVEGSNNLKMLNDKLDSLDVDELMSDLKESIENLNDTSAIISDTNDKNVDKEIEDELNELIYKNGNSEKHVKLQEEDDETLFEIPEQYNPKNKSIVATTTDVHTKKNKIILDNSIVL
jgi:hypothetical protein